MDDLPMPAGVDPVAIGVLSDGSTEGAVLWSLLIARIARFLQRAVPGSGQPLLLADSPGLASTVTATTRLLGGSVLFTDETLEDPWKARAAVLRGKGDMILAGAELDDISAEQLEAYPVVFAWVLSYVLANWRELGKGGSMVLRIWKLLANKLPALVHRELPKGVRPCLRAAFWPTDVLASFSRPHRLSRSPR
jgi:hypothetical protein